MAQPVNFGVQCTLVNSTARTLPAADQTYSFRRRIDSVTEPVSDNVLYDLIFAADSNRVFSTVVDIAHRLAAMVNSDQNTCRQLCSSLPACRGFFLGADANALCVALDDVGDIQDGMNGIFLAGESYLRLL